MGYIGMFTRDQAEGAIPNGARIVKSFTEEHDANPVGTLGTVLGSIEAPPGVTGYPDKFFYFVEWDPSPRLAVGVRAAKIAEVKENT
jgi:hypothetical protein